LEQEEDVGAITAKRFYDFVESEVPLDKEIDIRRFLPKKK
jgi:hypothetical protein